MTTLTIKYNRKDFFNHRIYTEDICENFTKSDPTKAFLFMSKNHDSAIQIDNMVIVWDNMSDYEKKVVSVRVYSKNGHGYTEGKAEFEKIKKDFYAKFKKADKSESAA